MRQRKRLPHSLSYTREAIRRIDDEAASLEQTTMYETAKVATAKTGHDACPRGKTARTRRM